MSLSYLEVIDYQTPEFAEFYDELPLWSARFAFELLDRIRFVPKMTILDVGAGTGFLSIELAQRCRDATVIAIDPWQVAMARLDRKLTYLSLTNVRTVVCDAAKIDLPDEAVDLIVSNLGINNFDDPDAVLRTCHRVARPGATLLMTTNLIGHMAEFYEVYRRVLVELKFQEHIPALDSHIAHRASIESIDARLAKAGFEFVVATTSSFHDRYLDGSSLLRHFFIRVGFVQGWKSIAPPEQVQTIFAILEQRLNDLAAKQGGLTLTIPAACIEVRKP